MKEVNRKVKKGVKEKGERGKRKARDLERESRLFATL